MPVHTLLWDELTSRRPIPLLFLLHPLLFFLYFPWSLWYFWTRVLRGVLMALQPWKELLFQLVLLSQPGLLFLPPPLFAGYFPVLPVLTSPQGCVLGIRPR